MSSYSFFFLSKGSIVEEAQSKDKLLLISSSTIASCFMHCSIFFVLHINKVIIIIIIFQKKIFRTDEYLEIRYPILKAK